MIRDGWFYIITDLMHHNVYASLLKEHIKKEERVIIKVFKKDNEIVVMENYNFVDTILKDTRKDKNVDITNFDLIYLKVLDRYYSDYEMPGMIYEYVEGLGAWCRVKIDGYDPNDKLLKPFFLKKKISKNDLKLYSNNNDELKRLETLYDLTKGLIKFSKMKNVKELFEKIEKDI